MTTSVIAFLALAALASGSAGAGSVDTPNEWTELDREIERLETSLAAKHDGPRLSGFIKARYEYTNDTTPNDFDTSGFVLSHVWLEVTGNTAKDFHYDIGMRFDSNETLRLQNATVSVPLVQGVRGTVGRFKPPFLYSATCSRTKNVFIDRTTQGSLWTRRDEGAMLDGRIERFRWHASAQNGGDGPSEKFVLTGKAAVDIAGPGIEPKQEGGYGVDSETRITMAVEAVDEGTIDNGTVLAGELEGAAGRFFFHGEVVDYGSGFVTDAVHGGAAENANRHADTTPYGLTLAAMITARLEVAARYEDLDDLDHTHKTWLGTNWYVQGHEIKWQLNWVKTENLSEVLQLGVTLAY